MSTTTTTTPGAPFQQWQNFYPANAAYPGFPGGNYPYDAPTTVNTEIYANVMGNAERTKQQAANDIARDILRAVDQNGAANMSTTERVNSQLATAVERNGANNMSTTERTSSQVASAVERNGAVNSHITELSAAQLATAIERNGANGMSTTERVNSQLASAVDRNGSANLAAIERTSGEARLTTVISEAANRQSANDNIRDVLSAVERNGFNSVLTTKDTHSGLLATIERNAGEGRVQTLTSAGIADAALRDVRYSILNDLNRVGNDLNMSGVQNFNVLSKSVTDGAWESRTAMANGFQNISEEHLRTKFDLSKGMDAHYASLMLEQQKLGQFMASKSDSHFAANQLEMQKVKEGLANQASNNFAINQLEMQKVKEGLACQAAQNFSISQLEAQKNREAIQKDLAEAKYEALKSQQYLSDKMCECCCEIKGKMDLLDRDRLRDNLVVEREDNNLLKILEVAGLARGGYGGYERGSRSPGRRRH